jgi:hypothetical protein
VLELSWMLYAESMGRSSEIWLRGYVAGTFTYATPDFPALWASTVDAIFGYSQRRGSQDVA